jgi:hypothetical protein
LVCHFWRITLASPQVKKCRPRRKNEQARFGEPMLKKVRQLVESVTNTLKGRLDLERRGGRSFVGVAVRVAQRVVAMSAAVWHRNRAGGPISRSLLSYGQWAQGLQSDRSARWRDRWGSNRSVSRCWSSTVTFPCLGTSSVVTHETGRCDRSADEAHERVRRT